ncbi:MAG: hypothetical protein HY815_00190 [Candidatus Riflebacteria bacterium]|nr:hypothetical protein [Candidatus Riflebacteria bacterium]
MTECELFERLVLPAVPEPASELEGWRAQEHLARCSCCRERAAAFADHLTAFKVADELADLPDSVFVAHAALGESVDGAEESGSRLPGVAVLQRLGRGPVVGIGALALVLAVTGIAFHTVGGFIVPIADDGVWLTALRQVPSRAFLIPALIPLVALSLIVPALLAQCVYRQGESLT